MFNLANSLWAQGERKEALSHYGRAVELAPRGWTVSKSWLCATGVPSSHRRGHELPQRPEFGAQVICARTSVLRRRCACRACWRRSRGELSGGARAAPGKRRGPGIARGAARRPGSVRGGTRAVPALDREGSRLRLRLREHRSPSAYDKGTRGWLQAAEQLRPSRCRWTRRFICATRSVSTSMTSGSTMRRSA